MASPLTLVIDQGTHATRALALDENGGVRIATLREIGLRREGLDRVEQDGDEIVASAEEAIREVLAEASEQGLTIARAGLATQRSTVVAWDRHTGKPLAPVLSWLDRRCASWLRGLNVRGDHIKERTGLPLSPHYGAGKLRWYLDHVPAVRRAHEEGRLAMGPLASFVLFHLLETQPFIVDHANASRTQLFSLERHDFDPELLGLYGIPREVLPGCLPICHDYGLLKGSKILVSAVNGDQTSALYSLGRPPKGTAIINLGSGGFVLFPTGIRRLHHPTLLSGPALSTKNRTEYLIEGTVNGAGVALDWAARRFGIPDLVRRLPSWLSREEAPPIFLNTVGGLGSPWWRPGPAPTLLGPGEPWQKAVAVAESILFMIKVNLDVMAEAGLPLRRIQVGGNLARLDGLGQRLADLTGLSVYRPAEAEATARGIAWLAAGRPKRWPRPGRGRTFKPKANLLLSQRYTRFRRALDDKE